MANTTPWFRRRARNHDAACTRQSPPSKVATSRTTEDTYAASSTAGEGAFATVKIVKRHRDGALFALKTFTPGLSSPRKIQAEFYVAQGMRHRNIITTYELLSFQGSQGLLMEYAPGCLLDLVTSSALRPGDAEVYLNQLLSGTVHIHRMGFVHRDLKLENVVLGVDGQLKIVDFGSVSVAKPTRPTNTGSIQYMSPELFNPSIEYDPQLADLWALGIIYLSMILGKFPWAVACSYNAAFAAYMEADRRWPRTTMISSAKEPQEPWPHPLQMIIPEMRSILHGMLRVEPSHRASLAMALKATKQYIVSGHGWSSSTDALV